MSHRYFGKMGCQMPRKEIEKARECSHHDEACVQPEVGKAADQ
jgi:hypothetical protein